MCERIHGGDPHSIYIYRTSEMDDKGNVKVVHCVEINQRVGCIFLGDDAP